MGGGSKIWSIFESEKQSPRGRFSMIFGIVAMPPQGLPRVAQGSHLGLRLAILGAPLGSLWQPFGSPWRPLGLPLATLGAPLAYLWRHFSLADQRPSSKKQRIGKDLGFSTHRCVTEVK